MRRVIVVGAGVVGLSCAVRLLEAGHRVDIVARGVIKACLELGYDRAEKISIFRIPGAWEEEGFKILEK